MHVSSLWRLKPTKQTTNKRTNRNWQLANIRFFFLSFFLPFLPVRSLFSIFISSISLLSYFLFHLLACFTQYKRRSMFVLLAICCPTGISCQTVSLLGFAKYYNNCSQNNDMNCVRQIDVVSSVLMVYSIFCYCCCCCFRQAKDFLEQAWESLPRRRVLRNRSHLRCCQSDRGDINHLVSTCARF